MAINVHHKCGKCGARIPVPVPTMPALSCQCCHTLIELQHETTWENDGCVKGCPCCGGSEFFVRRDFPQRLGLAIVVAAALASFVLLSRHTLLALGILAGVVALDAVIYLFVGKVTVCYRCRAEFRGFRYNPAHHAFDLATAEKYPKN